MKLSMDPESEKGKGSDRSGDKPSQRDDGHTVPVAEVRDFLPFCAQEDEQPCDAGDHHGGGQIPGARLFVDNGDKKGESHGQAHEENKKSDEA